MIFLPSGGTRFDVVGDPGSAVARIERVLTPRIAVGASADTVGALDLEAKVVVLENLAPIFLAAVLGTDGIGLLSTLFFGPVQVDWGRRWGGTPGRWGSAQLAASPYLSMLIGVEAVGSGIEPFLGFRIFPLGSTQWEIGLSARRDRFCLSIGGVLW